MATQLSPAPDTTAAEWLVADVRTFAESVLSLLPAGFESYVRVFHPAERHNENGEWFPVRWSEIARAMGTVAHPTMQLVAVARTARADSGVEGVYDDGPWVGSPPLEVRAPIVEVLARHTTTPDSCAFAFWEGRGWYTSSIVRAPLFGLPHRDYHLVRGPVSAALEDEFDAPNIWWPNDHAWCVATEIDLNTTYIGCSAACARDLVASPDLESHPIDPSSGVTWDSDATNPMPSDGSGWSPQSDPNP